VNFVVLLDLLLFVMGLKQLLIRPKKSKIPNLALDWCLCMSSVTFWAKPNG